MSTHKAEIDLLIEMIELDGGNVTRHLNDEGRFDALSIKGAKSFKDIRTDSILSLVENLRPVYGAKAKKPRITLVGDDPCYTYSFAQLSAYSGSKGLLQNKIWRNEIPEGTRFISQEYSDPKQVEPSIRYWKNDDGNLVEFSNIADFQAHVNKVDARKNILDASMSL